MRLENIVALTYAELINSPYVSDFSSISFNASKVKRGDLFIAFKHDDIEIAIKNGAYGIMFEKPTQISDMEIAWIKVKNLYDAVHKIVRFIFIDKEIEVYECNEIVLELAKQIDVESENFIVLSDNIETYFDKLTELPQHSIALFSPTHIPKDIFPSLKQLPQKTGKAIEIIEQTLFETSFIYDDIFYERQLLSPFFMPYLEELLNLFKILKINFKLKKFLPIKHFEAVFVNKNIEIKEFGSSDKVLIFEKSTMLILQEMKFLQQHSTWAKTIYIIPYAIKDELDYNIDIIFYKTIKELKQILKELNFHFALIVGVDKSILSTPTINQRVFKF